MEEQKAVTYYKFVIKAAKHMLKIPYRSTSIDKEQNNAIKMINY